MEAAHQPARDGCLRAEADHTRSYTVCAAAPPGDRARNHGLLRRLTVRACVGKWRSGLGICLCISRWRVLGRNVRFLWQKASFTVEVGEGSTKGAAGEPVLKCADLGRDQAAQQSWLCTACVDHPKKILWQCTAAGRNTAAITLAGLHCALHPQLRGRCARARSCGMQF